MSDERISHYRIVRRIGRGAMGEVYQAVDERLGRSVALKLLPSQIADNDLQARLLREAQSQSAINHPGIVTVHDIGAYQGRIFMVMELVDGDRLSDVARQGISVVDALALVADAADALAAAHARAILHRDVKSDNLMRTRDGRVKVLDFGLAKALDGLVAPQELSSIRTGEVLKIERATESHPGDALAATLSVPEALASSRSNPELAALQLDETMRSPLPSGSGTATLTHAGGLVGTPAYMSPEQTMGKPADARSEVFSLAIVLYELVVGKRPFDRPTIQGVLEAINTATIVPPSLAAPDRKIPAAVDALVARALERDPQRRTPDMAAFAADVRSVRARLIGPRIGPGTVLAAGAIALVLAAGVGAWWLRHAAAASTPVVSATKRVTFDIGCAEHPSFTPDGKTLVLDGLVDGDYEILAIDLASGTKRRLTERAGWDWGPAVSRDGRSIAWVHAGDKGRIAMVMPLDGSTAPVDLGPTTNLPSWTRDGSVLLASDGQLIESVTPAGVRTALGRLPPHNELQTQDYFADGSLIAALAVDGNTFALASLSPRMELKIIERDLPYEPFGVVASPNQRSFYYSHRGGNAHEMLRRSRKGGPPTPVPGGLSTVSFGFSPDGKALAYSTCHETESLARLAPDGIFTELGPRNGGTRDLTPVSIDADHFVYSSNRSGPTQLWIADAKNQNARPIGTDAWQPAASPDHRSLAFVDHTRHGIFVVALDGSGERRITDDRSDGAPSFVRDGSAIVFQRHDAAGERVWMVPVAGGTARPISPAGVRFPIASPTEDRVFYLVPGAAGTTIMSTDLAGHAAPLFGKPEKGDLKALRVSPDGKRLAATMNDVDVVELAVDGSAPFVTRWHAKADGVDSLDYEGDGRSLLLSVAHWDGDVWIADGTFP